MAERSAEGLGSLVVDVLQEQDKAVDDALAAASDETASFESLELERSKLRSELEEAEARRDCLKSRHAALLATIGRAERHAAATEADVEALARSLDEAEEGLARIWRRTFAAVDERERDFKEFVAQLRPDALRYVDDDLSAELVKWTELETQAEEDLRLALARAALEDSAPDEATRVLRRACVAADGGDLSEEITATRRRVAVLADLVREQREKLDGEAQYLD